MASDIIKKHYYNPETGFSGIDKIFRKLKPQGVTRNDVVKFLKSQQVYQVNKKNNRKQASFIPRYPLQEFQIDLIYIEHPHLNQARYGLCCIDAFTKKADIELMKKKTQEETVRAMEEIFLRMDMPHMIYCDEGSEFNNRLFKQMCKKFDIKLVFTIRHAPIVERFNRTIKEMIEKYLQSTNTKTIINVLPKLVENYNNSYHSTIGMAPNEVTDETKHIAQINLINNLHSPPRKRLKVGDQVRVQVKPKSFVKGYKPKFSKAVYTITEVGKGWYKTDKDDRQYFLANLQKVDAEELNPEEPDLENTREGHLRRIRMIRNEKPDEEEAEQIEEEPPRRRSVRERAPANRVVDPRYGKLNW